MKEPDPQDTPLDHQHLTLVSPEVWVNRPEPKRLLENRKERRARGHRGPKV